MSAFLPPNSAQRSGGLVAVQPRNASQVEAWAGVDMTHVSPPAAGHQDAQARKAVGEARHRQVMLAAQASFSSL